MKVSACSHESHRSPPKERLEQALFQVRERGLRLTTQRKEILGALAKSKKPLSSEELFSQLESGDLVTVYRSLSTLEEAGLLARHDFGDGVRRYELKEASHHHHFVRCRSCGEVEAFEGCEFDSRISKALARKGYEMIQHSLDVLAVCAACRN